jgi:hypothetical protein
VNRTHTAASAVISLRADGDMNHKWPCRTPKSAFDNVFSKPKLQPPLAVIPRREPTPAALIWGSSTGSSRRNAFAEAHR